MANRKNGPKVQHSALTIVRTGRYASPRPPLPTFDVQEAVRALRDTGIAEFRNLDGSIFSTPPYVELSPRVPLVDGKGWVSFLIAWDVQPADGGSFGSPTGVAASRSESSILMIRIIGLPRDTLCIVTVATFADPPRPEGAGYQVDNIAIAPLVFVPAINGPQTLAIVAQSSAIDGSLALSIHSAQGRFLWEFYLATVRVVVN